MLLSQLKEWLHALLLVWSLALLLAYMEYNASAHMGPDARVADG